ASIMSSLPLRYCDIPPEQRPVPLLAFVKQLNPNPPAAGPGAADDQARSMRNPAMASLNSFDARTNPSMVGADEYKEKYRSRPLPMAPAAGNDAPPPLPAEPMPSGMPMSLRPASARAQSPMPRAVNQTSIDAYHHSAHNPLVLSPYSPGDAGAAIGMARGESPIGGASPMTSDDPYTLASAKMRHQQPAGRLHTPVSPLYNGAIDEEPGDSDAGYFRDAGRPSLERDPVGDHTFRVHKSTSIQQYH
ncbi:hypothetical protein H4R21_004265, partial [Coemansia helicoidea]